MSINVLVWLYEMRHGISVYLTMYPYLPSPNYELLE